MLLNRKINWLQLIGCIVIVELVGSLSGLLAGNIKAVYQGLNLPALSPPATVFGPVWILLYLMIGIVAYLILRDATPGTQKNTSLALFGSQLLLNFIWSIVFFGANAYWFGLVIIILLDLIVLTCILAYRRFSPLAAYLLIPYFVWLLFATYLTIGVALGN